MADTPEKTRQLKEKIISQYKNFPEEQQEIIKKKIDSMSDEEFENFISEQQCIFCAIIRGDIPSTKLEENDSAIAVLEIKPKSKGHTLVINKEHNGTVDQEMIDLSKKISQKILEAYKPKDISVNEGKIFGHTTIEIIPNYAPKTYKKQKSRQQLEDIKEKILTGKTTTRKTTRKPLTKKKIETEQTSKTEKTIQNISEEEAHIIGKSGLPHFEERIP